MSVSSISATIASVTLACLILGFVFGWVRGYQKSLTRFIMVLVVAVIAFFVVPALTNSVLMFNLTKYNVTVGSKTVSNVKELIIEYISQIDKVRELMQSSPTMKEFVTALPAMLVNVVLFTVVFFILKYISMIIYWIIAGVCFNKKKLEGKNKIKLLGAGLGTVQAFIAVAILLVPMFGFANIANQVTTEYNANTSTIASAAVSASYGDDEYTLVADGNVGGENKSTQEIDKTVKQVDKYASAFENTWVVKVYSAFGINKLSISVFNSLSEQKVNGVKTNLTNEMATISKMLPYAENLLNSNGEIDSKFVENLDKLTRAAFESKVLDKSLNEIVSTAARKWANDEPFLGINRPTVKDSASLNHCLQKAFDELGKSGHEVDKDINAIINVLQVLTEEDASGKTILSTLTKGDTVEILNALSDENKNTFENLINAMVKSTTLSAIIPDVINVGLDFIYDALGTEVELDGTRVKVSSLKANSDNANEAALFGEYKVKSTDNIIWSVESKNIQKILGNLSRVYADFDANEKKGAEKQELIKVINFEKIGASLDAMKASALFNAPAKKIFESFLNNNMLSVIPEGTKLELLNNWDTINMQATFASLNEMVILATKLNDKASNLTKDDISNVLDAITKSDVSSGVIDSILTEDNLKNAGLDNDTATAVKDTVSKISTDLKGKTDAEKKKELDGISSVIEVIGKAGAAGETDKVTIENTDDFVDSIAGSSIIKDIVTNNAGKTEGKIDVSSKIDETTKANLSNSIKNNNTLTDAQKDAFLSMLTGTTSTGA